MKENMLQEFITSALIIDDKVSEIEQLEEYLDSVGIWAKHYTPEMLRERISPFNNRKLIFLDLFIDESDSTVEGNISKIRKHFEKVIGVDFGSYGIALWSKDPERVQTFSDKIFNTNNKYTRPLFVVALDKTKYLQSNDFSTLLSDLEAELSKDVSASFFVEWNKAVKKGSDNTISTLYNLFNSNEKKNQHLEAVLFSLARNYTGVPLNIIPKDRTSLLEKEALNKTLLEINPFLQRDLIKSLMDTLQVEISNSHQNVENLFYNIDNLEYESSIEKTEVFSKLNSLLLLDFDNLQQDAVLPGNIYEVKDISSPIYFKSFYHKETEINIEEHCDFNYYKAADSSKKSSIGSKVNKRIAIEITPPCDFSGKKKQLQSRIIGGAMIDCDDNVRSKYFKGEGFYSFLHPIYIDGLEKPQMIIFDFYRFQTINENELKELSKYMIISKTKDKLFADILQKLSSHTARLGIAILYP